MENETKVEPLTQNNEARGPKKKNYFKNRKNYNNNNKDRKNSPIKQLNQNLNPEKIEWNTTSMSGYAGENYPKDGSPIKVIPLGGVEEIGINTTVFEQDNDMIIVDMGLGFPKNDQMGIDYIIPNYEYVKANLSKLRGIIITHGHLDHIGAIPYVIASLGYPTIYCPKLASDLIREKAEEFNISNRIKIQEIDNESKFNLGSFGISFFRVNHNIPFSHGIIIKSKYGNIVHTGDFKFDNTPYQEPITEYNKLARAGDQGVLFLLSDSTNSFQPGWSVSESSITKDLDYLFANAKGRVITATFATLITRLVQLTDIAQKYGRKVAITGRSIENAVEIAKNIGLIKAPASIFIKPEDVEKYPDDEILILATGSQGEPNASLARMAHGEHKSINLKPSDTVILSSSKIPENVSAINKLINELTKTGVDLYNSDMLDIHAGGHAHVEDHKLLLHLTRPRFFMPIHGEPYMIDAQKKTALKIGYPLRDIVISENGSIIELTPFSQRINGKVNAEPLLVDGLGVGDIGSAVLQDRQKLSDEGIVVIILNLKADDRRLMSDIGVVTRGFIYVKSNEEMINAIKEKVKAIVDDTKQQEPNEVRDRINKEISAFLYRKTQREPMIMSLINLF